MKKFFDYAAASLTVVALVALLGATQASAGGKISIDDTKWISLGIGGRASVASIEDAAPSGRKWSKDFNLDNARIYISGQVHEKIKFELNTECVFGCGTGGDFVVLDAIAKFEFNPYINIWAGRVLVPAERQELNGPFYSSTYDAYKTPFYSSDRSGNFGNGGAGVYARDHGVNLWGAAGPDGALQYVVGVFSGLRSDGTTGPNRNDNPLFAGRVAYNFLNVEKNPGYYTSGTYYGGGGDIFTVAAAMQYQEDGSGSMANPGDFFGFSADVLFEKVLGSSPDAGGVLTFNGEYKHFDAGYSPGAFTIPDPDLFPMFDGDSFSVVGLYLLPKTIGIGKLQPYVRYTGVYPSSIKHDSASSNRDEVEAGINYIIDGHNARVSLFYQYGDIATKGLNYAPTTFGNPKVSAIKLALQIQI